VEHITIKSPDLSSLSCSASTKLKSAEWKRKYGVWLWTAADSSPYRRFLRGNRFTPHPSSRPSVQTTCWGKLPWFTDWPQFAILNCLPDPWAFPARAGLLLCMS